MKTDFMLARCVSFLAAFLAFAQANANICVTDDTNQRVCIKSSAKRIVALAPHIVETLYAIDANQQIAGTVEASVYPFQAKTITRVGNHTGIDIETILLLKPDLVITWGNTHAKAIAAIKQHGIPIFVTEPRKISDIARSIRQFGQLAGKLSKANQVAESFQQQLVQLVKKYKKDNQNKKRVFLQLWRRPIITIGQQSFLNEALVLCGAVNIFQEQKAPSFTVSPEAVLMRQPDIIAASLPPGEEHWKTDWQRYPSLKAVQKNKLFSLDIDELNRPSPRFLYGNEKLCQIIER